MKHIYKYLALATTFFLLNACGGDSKTTTSNPPNAGTAKQTMTIGKKYIMKRGDSIIKERSPSTIVVETDVQTGVTTALLRDGKARIE